MAQAEQSVEIERRGTEKGQRKRNLILRELLGFGGKAKTSEISEAVGFSSALVRSHCDDVLNEMSPPLVERDGKERNPNGMDYVVYRLTPTGKTAAERLTEEDLSIDEAKSFAELRSELITVRGELEELREAHNELVEALQSGVEPEQV